MIADIVIIVILLIFLIVGISKGFMKQVFGLIGTIAAIIIAVLLCRSLADFVISHTSLKATIAPAIAGFLGLPEALVDAETASASLQESGMPGFLIEALQNYMAQLNETTFNLSVIVSEALAEYLIVFICFIVIFIGVKLLTLILKGIAAMLQKITLIKIIDKIAGAAVGLFKGLLIVYSLLYLINLLSFDFMAVIQQTINESVLANFLSKYNPFILLLAPIITLIAPQ